MKKIKALRKYCPWCRVYTLYAIAFTFLLISCNNNKEDRTSPLFKVLNSKVTGIDFRNDLIYTKEFNLFKYMYFYNGSGVGAGDFNNDGNVDLFFGSNQGLNKIYLNKGQMKFEDVTVKAQIPDDKGWTTGISVVDINNDGLLDIYVCRVGQFETLDGRNLLLINKGNKNGIPVFQDEAEKYGLAFSGFSTQACFFDYDLDGDLDMYLMNHSVHQNGTFRPRGEFLGTYHPFSGDRFYKNDYHIGKLVEDIFTSDWFYDEKNIGVRIKSPIELVAGIQRILPMELNNNESLLLVQRVLGQMLFYPPNVSGWPGGKAWIDSSTLMFRLRLPQLLSDKDA